VLFAGCAELAPLRSPPAPLGAAAMQGISTRAEAVARLGEPWAVRPVREGEELVYRQVVESDRDPNRLDDRVARYRWLFIRVDPQGRVLRWAIGGEP
jgi:hypothetical protein